MQISHSETQNKNDADRVIKGFISELLEADTLTDTFIHKYLSEKVIAQNNPHIPEILAEIKKDFKAYSEHTPPELTVKREVHTFRDKEFTSYQIQLIWGNTMSFGIENNQITHALFLMKGGWHTKVYFNSPSGNTML